ncbi:ABC transporter ATP-binding protein [Candidatus Bathyarchaeota archaeon]|nr:ABC transporter ATP-binding protein [Candidatus Bathyarchaeota archaeon]
MKAIAVLKNVTRTFTNRTVLDKVNLQILTGEILTLLGPNGSGKTTLLKILASILRPTDGEIYFDGVKVTEQNVERMRMQSTLVFQKTVLFNGTVYDNIAYGLRIRRVPEKEINYKVTQILKLVRLEGFEKRSARKLSGGEQQRVALARALALDIRLLLLDEPTANLDPKNASIVEEVIATVNREHKITIVMATHNMFQAKTLPQRIALMSDGKITEVGTPAEIFGKLSKNLASFAVVGNTFAGTAEITEDGITLVDIGNDVQIAATAQSSGKVSVFISPEDIILSKDRFSSSARNIFKGRITEILDLDSVVRLKVDVGKPFIVQITKRSFNDMELNLNTEVYLAFKASSVQTI